MMAICFIINDKSTTYTGRNWLRTTSVETLAGDMTTAEGRVGGEPFVSPNCNSVNLERGRCLRRAFSGHSGERAERFRSSSVWCSAVIPFLLHGILITV
jgi:hypothetical protein